MKDKDHNDHVVAAPVSLVVSAVAPVFDVNKTLTPLLDKEEETVILFIDLGEGSHCMGGSVLAQCYQKLGQRPADIHHPSYLKAFFNAIQELKAKDLILAYHDRSDGGLLVTLFEMAFASHVGLDIDVSSLGSNKMAILFSEELGAALQVRRGDVVRVEAILKNHELLSMTHTVATVNTTDQMTIQHDGQCYFTDTRVHLQRYGLRLVMKCHLYEMIDNALKNLMIGYWMLMMAA